MLLHFKIFFDHCEDISNPNSQNKPNTQYKKSRLPHQSENNSRQPTPDNPTVLINRSKGQDKPLTQFKQSKPDPIQEAITIKNVQVFREPIQISSIQIRFARELEFITSPNTKTSIRNSPNTHDNHNIKNINHGKSTNPETTHTTQTVHNSYNTGSR